MGVRERWEKKHGSATDEEKRRETGRESVRERYENRQKYSGVDTSGVNDAYFESYNQAANSFFSNKELREDSYDQWQVLNNQADTIRAWAWQNRDKLGSNYGKIMSATDLSEAGQYWNQFKTAEDYAKEYGSYVSYNEMMNADLGALEQEIAEWEERTERSKKNPFAREFYKINSDELVRKRAYYNEAKNLQAGKAYDEQARLDPEFANISANGAVIAPNGRRIENWVAYYRDPKNYDKTPSFSTGHYADNDQIDSLESIAGRHMEEDEFATYNYLLGKGDKKAAAAYLKSLEYQLNQREASSIAANLKGRPIAEVAWAIPTGLDQFGSGINSAISSIVGNDGYITPSSIQMSSGMVREDLSDYGFKMFGSSVGQIAYDTLNTTANMAPSILAATAVNMVAPGAGAYVGAGLMGLSAGGNAYAEALNNGYSKDNARAYGLFVGASEAALQSVLGGISSVSGAGNLTKAIAEKAGAIESALLRVAAQYGISVAGEITEEELQNFLEPLFRTIFLGEEYDLPTIEELVQTALVTALSTGALESGGIISSEVGTNKYYRNTYGQAQSELVAEGLELDPQSRYFQRLDEKLHQGKDLTGNEIRNVVTRNERAIRNLGDAEVSVERAETEAEQTVPETAQNAPKIAQERAEVTAEQTVAKTENKADAESATAEATPNNENVQEQLAQASKDYGKQAKAMVANYIEGQDVAEYSAAFRIAYDMGASGVKLSYVEGMDSYLTASQRKIAYEAGKASQDMRAKTIDKNNQKAASGGTVRKKGAVRGDGVSIDDLTKRFNDTQRSAYSIMSTIAEVTGIDIVLYKSEADAKGNFTDAQGKYKKSEPGTLYIDINAGLNNIKSASDLANYTMLRTFSHEFVHFIENWNPVWYNELRRVVFDHIENADELIAREAAESGLPYERASREVIAEALTDILPDSSFIEDLANNHKNIFEKLLEKLKEFVASIKSHFSTLTPNTNKGAQQLKESGKYFEDVVKLYDKVATEAVENYQATVAEQKVEEVKEEVKAEPNEIDQEKPRKAKKQKKIASTEADFSNAMESVVNDDANPVPYEEIITDGITVTDGNGTQYSRRSMKADIAEGQMFEDLKTYCGWTQEKVDGLKKQLEDLVAYMAPYSDILDMNETYGREGRRYSPYKPNSDPLYTISMDFSTLCSKRLLTQYVIENLQLRENRPMSAEEQMAIRDMLKEYRKVEKGLQVACVMCYVEAARLKSPKQIQKWLDDPATAMRNYFADKNPEFSAYIKKAQEDFKESKGYDRNATKKEMSPKDVSALNKIRPKVRAEYQPSAEEMAIIETAKSLPNGTYLTAGNLADLSEKHPEIYKAYTAFIRTATRSKSLETDEPYYYGDSKRDNGNGIIVSDSFIEAVNRENGMRFSSWSDWRIQHMLDFITAVIDLSVRGAAMHGYTKFADEVRVLGKTGMMFNMSGVAGTQTGLNEDGTLNFSDTESINIDEAIALREELPETAGLQCIGVSKEHILALLRSDIIDYVIPYHTSGLNATLRRMGDIYGWMDFTSTQHALEDKSIKKESAIDQENWHIEPVFSEFFVGYDTGLDGVEAMRQSADNYIRMCRERGLIPKFNEFANEPGYWKLLIDRKMVNQKTNTLIQQKPVTPEFDFDVIKGIVDKYVKGYDSGLESRALDYIVRNWDSVPARIRDLKKQGSAKAKTTKKAIDQLANETLAAQPTDVQYSRRQQTDQAYMDAVESGDLETAQRMVNEAAKEAGYTIKAYHGTKGNFTVFDKSKIGSGAMLFASQGKGFYFTENQESADKYAKAKKSAGRVVNAHLKIDKPFTFTDKTNVKLNALLDEFAKTVGRDFSILDYDNFVDFEKRTGSVLSRVVQGDGEAFADFLQKNGYDGIAYTSYNYDTGKADMCYVVFNSEQIKSADPVTYDDDGNIIPLSERFDEAEEDIRYQRRANYAPGLTSGKPGDGMSYEVSVKDYTLKEVANMYHLGNLGAEYDALFDKVYAVCENMGITFDVVPIIRNEQGNEVPGVSTRDQVSFNARSFNSTKVDNEYKSKVILHEMLHAATTYALVTYYETRTGGATVEMPKNIYDSCMEINRVFNAIKNDRNFKEQYGTKDGAELVAELSNPEFVKDLKRSYPSALHQILDAICKLFGINKSFTNYDKLLKAVDEILTHPDYQLAKDYFIGDGKTTHYLDESQYADADVQEQLTLEDTDASYMAAVEDGDTETLQRMVEKAAREAGFDSPKLYHGTNTFGFTSIDTKKSNDRVSFFATDSLETASTYSGTNRVREIGEQSASSLGIYQFYANTEGMLETDADGAESNHIKLDGIEKKFNDFMMTKSWKTHATAKQLAKYAKQSGYSGVIIKNVIDTATPESRSAANTSTVYIFFDPQKQLASADTVTYDDDGNVVPLSERFSSESTDIRYQRRDGRMTDQEVLAYAVDMYEIDPSSMALSDAEKNAFELFKQRLAKLDDLTAQRYEQGQIYRENTFQKGGDRELAQKAHNRMEVLDKQIARASEKLLDVQEKTVLQGVLQKARKVVEQAETKRGDEKLKRWRERREEAASIKKYRDRILADRDELINWLNHPLNKDATKHINDNVKAAVIQFLLTIDTSSKQKLSGRGATKADEKHVKQAQKLMEMLNGLDDEVRYSGDYDLPLNFNDRLQRHINAVEDLLESYDGNTILNIMTVDELQDLSILTANLKTALTTLNKFHTNAMFAHVDAAGDNTVRYLRKMKDTDGNAIDNFVMWKNIRPAYAWERFGEGGVSIEQALRRGQSKLAWNAKEIVDYAKATFTKEERKDWEEGAVTVSISGDREIRVTVAALMSFYELSKRAQGRAHILSGGVTVSDVEIRENKKKRRIKGRYGKFTEADIDAMNAKLTDHQKEVADKLQQFMEKRGGEWGNHVTLARFGEKAFGEKGYFPISVDKQSLSTNNDKNVKGADLYRLLNMGFTKELSSNTSQPVVLYSIFDVFSTHMADMAQYNAMALPVLDAIRWLNYKHFEFEGDARVEKSNLRAELRRVYGAPVSKGGEVLSGYAESFIAHILQAYNGTEAQGTPGDSLGMQMLHTYNRAQIAFNMRVVVQQPMAITRASMVIDPKYITQALNPKLIKQNVDDMLAHSGIAVWKDLGYYDINISRGLTQMIKQESTFSEKVTEVGLKPAEFADKATWAVLWGACKLQLKAQGVTDYAEIEKLFDEVIYKTQVVDSVLTKSQYMRDKGFFARSTASFMSEPTTTASMLLGEFDAYRADIRRGLTARQAWNNHKKTIGKTVLVYSVSAILLSMVTAAADAWRDDDDYQNIAEKWNEAFWQNLLDEISPFNKLPLINNVWELGKVALDTFTNLDVYGNLPDAAWAQWADTLSKAWSITQELIEGESNYTWYAAIYKYLQVASGLSGLPISAGTREVVTVWNNVIGTFAPSLKIKDYELKPMTEIKYAVMDGYLTADQAADELYDQGLVYDREEADLTAELWAFLKDHKEYSDVSVSAYAKYKENCEGIDFGYFYQAWKYYSQTDADRDKDGEPISGSKKRKVLDFIYQMRLTPAQKKQLIKCFYK